MHAVDLDEHVMLPQRQERRVGVALEHLRDTEEGQDLQQHGRFDPRRAEYEEHEEWGGRGRARHGRYGDQRDHGHDRKVFATERRQVLRELHVSGQDCAVDRRDELRAGHGGDFR
jgi:hypothetical protein